MQIIVAREVGFLTVTLEWNYFLFVSRCAAPVAAPVGLVPVALPKTKDSFVRISRSDREIDCKVALGRHVAAIVATGVRAGSKSVLDR